mgnify:CR=1 FL=1
MRQLEQDRRLEGRPGLVDHPEEMLAALTECIDASMEFAARVGDDMAI